MIARFLASRSGATSIEYALVATFVSMLVVAGAGAIGSRLNVKFSALLRGFQ